MSLSLPSDTANPPPVATPPDASKAHPRFPIRAQLSLLWQRSVLTVRWLFRIPIDDIRDQQLDAALKGLMQNNRNFFDGLDTLIAVSNQMQRRLLFYEANIPRMRDLKREFDRQEEALSKAVQSPKREAGADLENGILPRSNGHRPQIAVVRS